MTDDETAPPSASGATATKPGRAKARKTPLEVIENIGNKVPHPAIIFFGLCVLVIVLSAILALFDVSVTYEVAEGPEGITDEIEGGTQYPDTLPDPDEVAIRTETTAIQSLLSVDGIRFLFTSLVSNFSSFSVVAVILVAMIGVGVAEEAGLMGALIRKLVKVAPAWAITWIVVFVGMLSSVASDAGYLILIPLAAAAYHSLGRHPLAGLAAAYAGVACGFAVNLLITPSDGILTEVTNEAIALANPDLSIGITANLWFNIASTLFITVVIVFVSRLVERRLGPYDPAAAESPGKGSAIRVGRAPQPSRSSTRRPSPAGCAAPELRCSRPWPSCCCCPPAGCSPPQPRDRFADRRRPADEQSHRVDHADLPVGGHRLRRWGEDDHLQHRSDQRHRQDVGVAGRAAVHAVPDRPVHRLLQLLRACRRCVSVAMADLLEQANVGPLWRC